MIRMSQELREAFQALATVAFDRFTWIGVLLAIGTFLPTWWLLYRLQETRREHVPHLL